MSERKSLEESFEDGTASYDGLRYSRQLWKDSALVKHTQNEALREQIARLRVQRIVSAVSTSLVSDEQVLSTGGRDQDGVSLPLVVQGDRKHDQRGGRQQ